MEDDIVTDELNALIKKLHEASVKLKQEQPYLPKWKHSQDNVQEVQEFAREIITVTSSKLEKLLRPPGKSVQIVADADLFYEGRHDKVLFPRTKDWFEEMGFKRYNAPYTYADNWDKQYIYATYLIPDTIEKDQKVPLMWFFHGGGFCTGAGEHIPWYSKATLAHAKKHKAIVIAPDYPLGPEGNYHDIYLALRDFLRFYREDGCFVDNEDSWTNWLGKKIGQNVTIDKDNIFIEGESAGGHAAVTTMFLNAVKTAQPLHIKAVFLRYPMLKHYKRKWPEAGSVEFMGQNFSQAEIQDYEKELKAEVLALETLKSNEQTGFVRTRTKGYAPEYMWAAPLLSLTGEWQWMFQRDHGLGKEQTIDESLPWNLDCLERAEKMHDKVNHACLPPTIMHHAYDDTNCPYPDTQKFKELFHQYYPTAYPQGDEKVLLIGVGQLMSHPRVLEGTMSDSTVGHGYDYWQDDEAFQLESYKRVENYWPVTAGV